MTIAVFATDLLKRSTYVHHSTLTCYVSLEKVAQIFHQHVNFQKKGGFPPGHTSRSGFEQKKTSPRCHETIGQCAEKPQWGAFISC